MTPADPEFLPPDTERTQTIRKLQSERFSRYFLLVILVGIMLLFFNMIRIFLLPILMAAVFTTLFYPLYRWILRLFRHRRGLASFACCVLLLIGLLIPIYVLANLVTHQAVQFYQTAEEKIRQIVEAGDAGPMGKIKNAPWVKQLKLDQMDWQSIFQDVAKTTGTLLATVIRKTSGGAFFIVANVFVTLFIIFYFFRDGEQFLKRLKYLVPLSDQYEDALVSRFVAVSRATIKGTILIGLTQSTIGAITLWIFGVESAALWFVVMLILSMIPIVGAWLVMHPAAIIQILIGNVWQGVGIFLITILIISNIDNVMRPRLVGQFSGLHDLLIFFSALGGIATFGPMGVIVGPIVAAFFVTILEIYSHEFRSQLELSQTATPVKQG